MKSISEVVWLAIVAIALTVVILSKPGYAASNDIYESTRLSPSDYLLRSQEARRDPVFDNAKPIELGVNLGVGSDCGRIDFKSTLKASLQNVLDMKYFGDLGTSIVAASPMLLTCYFSPTWCAILKHSQINANYLSQMRLDQCSLIDKYVDSRTEDYYQERQACVRKSIETNGGNLERALETCGQNVYSADLTNWAGSSYGEKASTNRLIDSSAKWAGMDKSDSQGSLDLVKALVGETVVSKGSVRVEYGPRQSALTPRTYLQSIETVTYDKLCKGMVQKLVDAGPGANVDRAVTDDEIHALSPNSENPVLDRQTLRSLVSMSTKQRAGACQRLSDAVAMTAFTTDLNRSLDILTTLSQNPNLPENRKVEIEQKRKSLKEQVELAVTLHRERTEPLNNVMSQINEEGAAIHSRSVGEGLSGDATRQDAIKIQETFMDCSDGVLCGQN